MSRHMHMRIKTLAMLMVLSPILQVSADVELSSVHKKYLREHLGCEVWCMQQWRMQKIELKEKLQVNFRDHAHFSNPLYIIKYMGTTAS